MPRPEVRPPGPGDILIPATAQRPTFRGRRRFRQRVVRMVVPWRISHPVAVWQALSLADVYGRGINGQRGTISTGASRNGIGGPTGDPAYGFTGYGQPPQIFTGWNPAAHPHVGTAIKGGGNGLPFTSLPAGSGSALDTAMLQIMAGNP